MDSLGSSEFIRAIFFGVAVPISSLAVVTMNCGGNRRQSRKVPKSQKVQRGSSKKHGHQLSTSQKHGNKQSGVSFVKKRVSSKKQSDSQKHQIVSMKKEPLKKQLPNASKRPLKRKPSVRITQVPLEYKSAKDASKRGTVSNKSNSSKKSSRKDSSKRINSKISAKEKSKAAKYVPPYGSEVTDLKLEPKQLVFNFTGGQERIQLHNSSTIGSRYAIKLKCSDNNVYHFNPVYAIVEPGETLQLNAYRNNTVDANSAASMPAKLVFLVTKISKDDSEPKNAFKNATDEYPKMMLPLLVSDGNKGIIGISNKRCICIK
ncbi:MSP (Major sperm protein) domain-containing protein [Ditylenchus destructor]|uniref:Major sperm protein n=1 Tax=Ditylenchus destructor TaxID=166010 RepID=A0AAD4R9K9_9BILA|nr:MSP (Major sperm protein) domain-containing protein [Ditylenchus destructor]